MSCLFDFDDWKWQHEADKKAKGRNVCAGPADRTDQTDSTVGIADRIMPEKPGTDITFTRFDRGELPEYGQVRVKYTNIDFSRHTNNIEYIRFDLGIGIPAGRIH